MDCCGHTCTLILVYVPHLKRTLACTAEDFVSSLYMLGVLEGDAEFITPSEPGTQHVHQHTLIYRDSALTLPLQARTEYLL